MQVNDNVPFNNPPFDNGANILLSDTLLSCQGEILVIFRFHT